MNRRDAVRRIALLMGGTLVASEAILRGQTVPSKMDSPAFTDDKSRTQPVPAKAYTPFTDDDRALLDEIGDAILPETDIPGAKAVNIGAFMIMMVTDCYDEAQHAVFKEGLTRVNEASRAKFGKAFVEGTPAERAALVADLNTQQASRRLNGASHERAQYFRMMKELTLLGYFSSEIGCTKAVRYIEVPGAFHGDIAYKKGDRAWY